MPPYSCAFNSIETLWAQVKLRFKKQVATLREPIDTPLELRAFVLEIAEAYPAASARKIARANREYVKKILSGRV